MSNPVTTAFPATGNGSRGDIIDLLQQRTNFTVFNVAEVTGNDFTNHRVLCLATTQRLYIYDADETGDHDGETILVDDAGNRFVLVPIGEGINFIKTLSAAEYAAIETPDAKTLYVVEPNE